MSDDVLRQPAPPSEPAATVLRTGFHVERSTSGDAVVVVLRGELDMATAPRLARALDDALDQLPTSVTIELAELGFLDSTGIRVLVTAHRRAAAARCRFVLRAPSGSVLKTLQLTGMDTLVIVEAGPALT